jgi:hypothetical protein
MHGDDRVRFCSRCSLHVYNLSALTRDAAEALVNEKEGRLCTRFYRRADGAVLTADCPHGRWRRPAIRLLACAGLLSVLTTGVLLGGPCETSARRGRSNHSALVKLFQRFLPERVFECLFRDEEEPVMGVPCPPPVRTPPANGPALAGPDRREQTR